MIIIYLLILIAVILALSYYTYYISFHSPAKRKTDPYELIKGSQYTAVKEPLHRITRIMEKTPFEEVSITGFDGVKLYGRYYHTDDHAPVQILFHGYRSHAMRDCAGGFILAKKMGFNVLVVDQRAHTYSGGRVITFGICERKDCLYWANYVTDRFGADKPIILSGLSMGAGTVLMASELPLPQNVCAIISDCGYSSPKAIIRKVCKDRHIPWALALPFLHIGARIFGNFSLNESSAIEAVKHATVPILLIHGESDRLVPCEMSRQICDACASPAQLHTFPDAGHGLCYMTDPLRYEDIVTRFLNGIEALQPHMSQNEYVQKELRGEMKY